MPVQTERTDYPDRHPSRANNDNDSSQSMWEAQDDGYEIDGASRAYRNTQPQAPSEDE